jgi:hypothetical protein
VGNTGIPKLVKQQQLAVFFAIMNVTNWMHFSGSLGLELMCTIPIGIYFA